MKTICFFNHINGSGKTKLSVKFYDYLTNKGYKVKGLDGDDTDKAFSKTFGPPEVTGEESNVQFVPIEDIVFTQKLLANNYDFTIIDLPEILKVNTNTFEKIPVDYLFYVIVPKTLDLELAKETITKVNDIFDVNPDNIYLTLNNVPFDNANVEEQINRRERIVKYIEQMSFPYPTLNNFAYEGFSEQFNPLFDDIYKLVKEVN